MAVFDTFVKMFRLFEGKDKTRLWFIFLEMILAAVFELMGVSFIFPFISILANPQVIYTNHLLHALYTQWHFTSAHAFLFFTGIVTLAMLVIGNGFSAYSLWRILKFSNLQEHKLSCRLLSNFLNKKYTYFQSHNSADLIKKIFLDVTSMITELLMPGLQMIAKILVIVFISLFLLITNPILAVVIVASFGGSYFLLDLLLKNKLKRIGDEHLRDGVKRQKIVTEAFASIKDIKLMHLENVIVDYYAQPSYRYSLDRALSRIIGQLPRYLPEVIAFGGIMLYLLYMLYEKQDLSHIIPLLATYAFAGMRLLPSVQFIYNSAALIRFGKPAFEAIYEDLCVPSDKSTADFSHLQPLAFKQTIKFEDIGFQYAERSVPVIQNLGFSILAGSFVAFVGETGAGKTTIIDILLGLLTPSTGKVLIDDEPLTKANLAAWQKNISYVPQNIYLIDDSIKNNIAFGCEPSEIDMQRVEQAAKIACLHDFIMQELPSGYETIVGEKAVRLSGGQCQRVGLARALYRNPEVLILDEATSALDNITEKTVLTNLLEALKGKTIIMVAHRLSTVQGCDKIIVLQKGGHIAGEGRYSELETANEVFKRLLNANQV